MHESLEEPRVINGTKVQHMEFSEYLMGYCDVKHPSTFCVSVEIDCLKPH